jgi:hypothetical protein
MVRITDTLQVDHKGANAEYCTYNERHTQLSPGLTEEDASNAEGERGDVKADI